MASKVSQTTCDSDFSDTTTNQILWRRLTSDVEVLSQGDAVAGNDFKDLVLAVAVECSPLDARHDAITIFLGLGLGRSRPVKLQAIASIAYSELATWRQDSETGQQQEVYPTYLRDRLANRQQDRQFVTRCEGCRREPVERNEFDAMP